MNIGMQNNLVFGLGGVSGFLNQGMKSTQQKQQRETERDSQIAFFQNQKENLKNMECSSLEEIARKLNMLHSYEDQIAEAKAKFNREQMSHVLDEAQERGEKIAEAAEKYAPKTPEEYREDLAEEAMETEESEGEMSELLEELAPEELEELTEELTEEQLQEIQEAKEQQELAKEQQEQQQMLAKEQEELLYPYRKIDLYA